MMGTKIPDWNKIVSSNVKKEDLYIKDNDYGYEKEPHITILYGIHDEEISNEELYSTLEKLRPIEVTISNISIFECDEYDVVKFDVPLIEELKEYRYYFEKFYPNTQTYDTYNPHMTIAYVLPGMGKKYIKEILSFDVTFDTAIYSYKDKKHIFNL